MNAPGTMGRAFAVGIVLNAAFVAAEAAAGVWINSLALVADAGHNLSDVLSLALAWGATALAQRQPSPRRTYGFRRTTILASLVNAVFLLIVIGAIAREAVHRFGLPADVNGTAMSLVAAVGILVNGSTTLLFASGQRSDLNIKGAFLHMAGDTAVSAGVLASGLIIAATGLTWIDPAMSLLITVLIALGTWSLLRDSANLALDAVPGAIDPAAVSQYLKGLPGVLTIHDLHIWAMSTTETALTVHLVMPQAAVDDAFLARVSDGLEQAFGIRHATVQVEHEDEISHCCQRRPSA